LKKLPFVLIAAAFLLLLLPASSFAQSGAKPDFGQAVNRLVAQGWPQRLDDHMAYMPGTNAQLGFYFAGSWSDNDRARYLAEQMRKMGLKNVHLEPVPVDAYDFTSGTVNLGSKCMTASTFDLEPPTPAAGITAPVVWAHEGKSQDFDTLAKDGVSVKGKIVIIDADPNNWWMNLPQEEAGYRGARGVIFTYGPTTAPYWSFAPDELGSFDSEARLTDPPAVYLSQQDGQWLESRIGASGVGPMTHLVLRAKVTLDGKGGRGYTVFGDLPGRVDDGTFVLIGAHHDGFFHTGTDNTSGCVGNLLMAKAMLMSGYRPEHTVRFMFTTAEEDGISNAATDWCYGAYWAINHAHPEWAGKIRAFFEIDHWTMDGQLLMRSPELAPLLTADATAWSSLLPNGHNVKISESTWMDAWTFDAAGVPTVCFATKQPGDPRYHSNYMTPYLMDWHYTGGLIKYIFGLEKQVNRPQLIPFGLKAQADALAATVVPSDLLAAGADSSAVNTLESDVTALQTAAASYEARAASIPAAHVAADNRALLAIWKKYNVELTGLSPYSTSGYRQQQTLTDVQSLNGAIAALQESTPDTATALNDLTGVDLNYYGTELSHPVYTAYLAEFNPSYYHAGFNSQGNPVWPLLDVMPQYNAISGGSWDATTISQLQTMRGQDLTDLNARLNAMSTAIEWVTAHLKAVN
jgi:hypothetical protein